LPTYLTGKYPFSLNLLLGLQLKSLYPISPTTNVWSVVKKSLLAYDVSATLVVVVRFQIVFLNHTFNSECCANNI